MPYNKVKEVVFLNGKFLPQSEAKLSLMTPGFLYGWGLFESMRSYNNRIVYLKQHLERIKNSCKPLEMLFPYSLIRLKQYIEQTVKINGFKDAYLRLTLWKKSETQVDTLIVVRKYHPFAAKKYRQGFRCLISAFRQNESSFFARLKTTNYLLYQISYLKAKHQGFDEALILNNRGYIAEGSRSNIFFVKHNEVFTPSLGCGCLDGITRRVMFDLAKKYNIKVAEGNFTLSDLHEADETFFTNSLMGVMPLTYLEKHPVAKGLIGKVTKFFMKKYNLLLRNGT